MLAGILALAFALALDAPATAQEITTEFWPEIDTFVRLSDSMRIYIPISKTREGRDDSDQDGTVGVYLDYYTSPIAKIRLVGPANVPRAPRLMSCILQFGPTSGLAA